jgi:hypothetical protein
MAQLFYLLEQIERCRRLAHDSTDPVLRDSLLKLADEYTARADKVESGSANASDHEDPTAWQAGSDDKDAD